MYSIWPHWEKIQEFLSPSSAFPVSGRFKKMVERSSLAGCGLSPCCQSLLSGKVRQSQSLLSGRQTVHKLLPGYPQDSSESSLPIGGNSSYGDPLLHYSGSQRGCHWCVSLQGGFIPSSQAITKEHQEMVGVPLEVRRVGVYQGSANTSEGVSESCVPEGVERRHMVVEGKNVLLLEEQARAKSLV